MIVRQSSQPVTSIFFSNILIILIIINRSIMYSKGLTVWGIAGALTVLSFILCSCMASCPAKSDVQSFEINQIVSDWYMVAATPTSGDSVSKCAHFNITSSSPDSVQINFTAVSRRSHKPVTFLANINIDGDNSGTWQLKGSKSILGPFKHRVIAVENGSYLVMVICGPGNRTLPLQDFSVILSHEKTLESATLTVLKKKLNAYFSSDKILDVEQDVCTY